MANDLRSLLEAIDDLLRAYKQRIAELEATVVNQQKIIDELRGASNETQPEAGDDPK